MIYIEKTQNLFDLVNSLDSILLKDKNDRSSRQFKFSIYELSKELYFLSTHRYIDNKDYLFNLEMKFSHYLQLLHIKPLFQLNVQERTGLSIDKVKKIKKIICFLNNPFFPKIYKRLLIFTLFFYK
jgi:hypothetical protein